MDFCAIRIEGERMNDMRCNFAPIHVLTGTLLILSPAMFAAPSPSKTQDESAKGARLLKSVARDARQIQASAAEFEKLTHDSRATWKQYDRQWNEVQPLVEIMHRKIARLEAIESSLSPTEKNALEQSKADYQKIAWYSHELGKLVDKVPAELSNPKFKTASRDLMKEAGDAAKAAKTGV
jgi:hypothetical protein